MVLSGRLLRPRSHLLHKGNRFMPMPKLEFEENSSSFADPERDDPMLPNPADTEYASPARDGVEMDDAQEFLAAEGESSQPTDHSIDHSGLAPKNEPKPKPKSPWASGDDDPIGGADSEKTEAAQDSGDFSDELLTQASQYGYDADAAKRFGSPENLRWAMADADRRAAEWGNQQINQIMQAQQPAPPQPPQAATPAQPPAAQQQPPRPSQFDLNDEQLRQQGFDDDTIAIFRGIQNEYRNEIGALRQDLNAARQQATGHVQADDEARFVQDMDAFFKELGPAWEQEFGNGNMDSLQPNSDQWNARRKVASTIFGLQFADAQSNRRPAPTKEVAQRALASLHFKKLQEIAGKNAARASTERISQATARSTGGQKQPITGFDKAVRRAVAFANKHKLTS